MPTRDADAHAAHAGSAPAAAHLVAHSKGGCGSKGGSHQPDLQTAMCASAVTARMKHTRLDAGRSPYSARRTPIFISK
eukprot:scaffold223681_cov18-Tisochrysis_lutea.AAC.1